MKKTDKWGSLKMIGMKKMRLILPIAAMFILILAVCAQASTAEAQDTRDNGDKLG